MVLEGRAEVASDAEVDAQVVVVPVRMAAEFAQAADAVMVDVVEALILKVAVVLGLEVDGLLLGRENEMVAVLEMALRCALPLRPCPCLSTCERPCLICCSWWSWLSSPWVLLRVRRLQRHSKT